MQGNECTWVLCSSSSFPQSVKKTCSLAEGMAEPQCHMAHIWPSEESVRPALAATEEAAAFHSLKQQKFLPDVQTPLELSLN